MTKPRTIKEAQRELEAGTYQGKVDVSKFLTSGSFDAVGELKPVHYRLRIHNGWDLTTTFLYLTKEEAAELTPVLEST